MTGAQSGGVNATCEKCSRETRISAQRTSHTGFRDCVAAPGHEWLGHGDGGVNAAERKQFTETRIRA